MKPSVHATAIIAETAELAAGVVVGPYVVIEDNVHIGEACRIDSHAVIKQFTRMGAHNHIHSHALVGGVPQDLKFGGEESWLHIGSHNNIREFSTLHRGTGGGGGTTTVGDHNLIMAYCHVAHDCHVGNHIVMSNNATLAGHVRVDDYAIIGGLSAIHQFCRIGRNAFVGGMTGIPQDLPPWMLATGSRAFVQGPNVVGLRRAGVSREVMSALKETYRLIWRSGMPRTDALAQLEQEYGDVSQVIELIAFIRSSERGICSADKSED